MTALPLANGLRRDLDRTEAEEREANSRGDARAAMRAALSAYGLRIDIADAESPEAITAALGLASMIERIGA